MTRKVLPAKDLGLAVDHLKMLDAMCKTFDARMRHGSRSASIKTFNLFLDFSLARDRVKRLEGQ